MVNIGFIGTGMMGNPMAMNLVKAGFPVIAFDKNRAAYQSLLSIGASAATSISSLSLKSELIISMVNDDQATLEVFLGKDGVIEGVNGKKIGIVMSTISPNTIKKIANQIKPIEFLDAPVSGGPIKAENASLAIMASGDFETYNKSLHILKTMGKNVFYTGTIGSAMTIKLINNIFGLANLLLTVEEMNFALKAGIDLNKMIEIIKVSSGSNFYFSEWAEVQKTFKYLTRDEQTLKSFLQTFIKDIQLAEKYAQELSFYGPLIRLIKDEATKIQAETYREKIIDIIR